MLRVLTPEVLEQETRMHEGSGGVSAENRHCGFRPAFLDRASGIIHPSCYASGEPAPFHLLDGLPDELVLARNTVGRVTKVVGSVISGFVHKGRFYTREEAACLCGALVPAEAA